MTVDTNRLREWATDETVCGPLITGEASARIVEGATEIDSLREELEIERDIRISQTARVEELHAELEELHAELETVKRELADSRADVATFARAWQRAAREEAEECARLCDERQQLLARIYGDYEVSRTVRFEAQKSAEELEEIAIAIRARHARKEESDG